MPVAVWLPQDAVTLRTHCRDGGGVKSVSKAGRLDGYEAALQALCCSIGNRMDRLPLHILVVRITLLANSVSYLTMHFTGLSTFTSHDSVTRIRMDGVTAS